MPLDDLCEAVTPRSGEGIWLPVLDKKKIEKKVKKSKGKRKNIIIKKF